jgi:hypothetical protein
MSLPEQHQDFDFNTWAKLAKDDPAAFERERQARIEALIAGAPEEKQERLRALQWRVDQLRARAANPLAATVQISKLMWDTLLGPHGLLETIQRFGGEAAPAPERPSAEVLAFGRRRCPGLP